MEPQTPQPPAMTAPPATTATSATTANISVKFVDLATNIIRRVLFPTNPRHGTHNFLRQLLVSMYGADYAVADLLYTDEDGDLVTIGTNEEWRDLVARTPSGKAVRVQVRLPERLAQNRTIALARAGLDPSKSTSSGVAPPGSRRLMAIFVKHVTVTDDTFMRPGQEFVKTWLVKNASPTLTWPVAGVKLMHIRHSRMGAIAEFPVDFSLGPGEEAEVSAGMRAPMEEGEHVGFWRFHERSGSPFGQRFRVRIIVQSDRMDSAIDAINQRYLITHDAGHVARFSHRMGAEDEVD